MHIDLTAYPNLIKAGVVDKRFQYEVRDNGGFCAGHQFKIYVYDMQLSTMHDALTTVRFTTAGCDDHIDLIRQYSKFLKNK